VSSMSKKLVRVATVVFLAVVVAACSGHKKAGSGASTADASGGTTVGSGSARSVGVGGDGGLSPEEMAARGMNGGLQYVFYFDFDQSALSAETRSALDAQAAALRGQSGVVRLEGHTDDRGTREYNLALGERRAQAVANYLKLQGVDATRIEVVSYGEERPAAMGEDESAWAKNRRVELH